MTDKIGLIVDSACDLPDEILEKYNMYLLPLGITFPEENKTYKHRVDITEEEYKEKIALAKEHPHTTQANGYDFVQLLEKIEADGYDQVFYVSIGTGISANYSTAQGHLKRYKKMGGKLDVHIYDSLQGSVGIGLQAIKAALLIQEGRSIDEIVEELNLFRKENLKVTFTVKSLKYLMRGGRVSKLKYAFGSLLNINPCMEISIDEGKIEVFTKSRDYFESVEVIVERAYEYFENTDNLACYIVEGNATEGAEKAREYIQTKYPNIHIYDTYKLGAVIYTHSGPGTVEIDFFKDFEH